MANADNYEIKIKDLALFVRNVQLSPAVRMGHVNALEMTSCKYPTYRSQSRYGSTWQHELRPGQHVLRQLPKRLVIGCVDSDALNGAITKNPFDFKHYKINFVVLNVDG